MNKVWKFHNDVDTDQIIASQYLLLPDIEAMKQYTFESLDPEFFIVIRLTSDFLLLYAKIYMNMWKMVDRQILIYLLVQLPLMGRYFPVQNFRNICRIF